MKNKKLIARLGAIFAAVLLVSLMALPCFGSVTYDYSQYVVKSANFTDRESLYQFLSQHTDGSLLGAVASIGGSITVDISNVTPIYDTSTGELLYFALEDVMIADVHEEGDGMTVYYLYYLVTPENIRMNLEPNEVYYQDGNGQVYVDVHTLGYLNDNEWGAYQFSVTVKYLDEIELPEADPDAPTRTGLYGECYHIIRDALYGKNAVLDSTQEFAITQVSTWMTYIVILLPFVVVAIILFRIFFR